MTASLKVALIQSNADTNKENNIASAILAATQAIQQGAQFILFPETFNQRGPRTTMQNGAETIPEGPSITPFVALANTHNVSILINLSTKNNAETQLRNTSLLLQPGGQIAAYHKIHLFDVDIDEKRFRESDLFLAGDTPVIGHVSGLPVGLSICYDIRFPELYRHYARHGAKILCIPASFTYPTGKAHWKILLQARAIENQCFVLAPNQIGVGANGVPTYGHSMIIDPWGTILCEGTDAEEEVLIADLKFDALDLLRRDFPVLTHVKTGLFGLR